MSDESRELALASVSLIETEFGPAYRALQEQFLASLAMEGVDGPSLRGESTAVGRLSNGDIVRSIVSKLPGTALIKPNEKAIDMVVETDQADHALHAQANTAFLRAYRRLEIHDKPKGKPYAPLYIVGYDASNQSNRRLLLAGGRYTCTTQAATKRPNSHYAKTAADDFQRTHSNNFRIIALGRHARGRHPKLAIDRHLLSNHIVDDATSENLSAMFNRQTGLYEVNAANPRSLRLPTRPAQGKNSNNIIIPHPDVAEFISNRDFASFNVLHHLTQLALKFDLMDTLKASLGE